MPSFDILFGDHWFTVEGKDYVVPVNAIGTCAFCLLADDSGYWLLGDVFMRGWYNIHDYTNNRMGFVPYQGSTKSKAEAKTSDPAIADPPAGTCQDTNNGAADSYGDDCAWYTVNSWGCDLNFNDSDFNAGSMCCACKGGSTGSGSSSEQCFNLDLYGQQDSNGLNCNQIEYVSIQYLPFQSC